MFGGMPVATVERTEQWLAQQLARGADIDHRAREGLLRADERVRAAVMAQGNVTHSGHIISRIRSALVVMEAAS